MTTKKAAIIIILIFAVILFGTSAYAGGNAIGAAAAICRDLGVLRGGVNGIDGEYLSSLATRLQALHITARLMGKESVASSYVWTDNFADADKAEYESGRNLLAFVKAHPELGWQGDYMGNIDPLGYITSQSMYKVLLGVLGYAPGEDFAWEDTVAFARQKGLNAIGTKRGYLTNNDLSVMLVEALKTRMKNSEETLCEHLAEAGVINKGAAWANSMLPGSPGFKPLLSFNEGGPLLVEVNLLAENKKVSMRFNTALNPTYAKALKNYSYYHPGSGYMPLPGKCQTSMADEYTVTIQFPSEGWVAFDNRVETDAFFAYIATDRKNELRVSGLYDVDGMLLRDVLIDVIPPAKSGANKDSYDYGGKQANSQSHYLR